MLTPRENLLEVLKGGKPDRFVNQYEAFTMLPSPYGMRGPSVKKGGEPVVNGWGVTIAYPSNAPGPFPVHTPDKIVIQDIENWRDYVKAPSLDFTQEEWDKCKAAFDAVDTTKTFKTAMVAPGIFEQCHYLCEIANALIYYITNPDEMHELIDYITEWELELAKGICEHLHPDAILHHDDWGSELSTFISPDMFKEFFVEPYKKIYGYYKEHGVQVIVHHSDSYCATLVPHMIEMGIDIWQGCMQSNNVPELVKQYGGQITFMGDIDSKVVDFEGSTPEKCYKEALRAIEANQMLYFIPCSTQGGPGSIYPGVYQCLSEQIDKINKEKFGVCTE